jgi:GDP-4-dehydro-6-deoxy-D-mannose reductase
MKKALITGADGFLGSHLTDFLLDKNFEVYGLKRPNNQIKNLSHYTGGKKIISNSKKLPFLDYQIVLPTETEHLTLLECDLNNAELLEQIIKEIKPVFIFHFGAQSYVIPSWEDPRYTVETNIIGTINVFEPLKKHSIESRVIVACSSAEYGTTTEKINRPLKESDSLRAVHPYGISKIATELLARQYHLNFGIDLVNLRFFNQTGPRKVNDACSDFIRRIAQIELGLVEPVIEVGNLSPYRDITGIKDSLHAIWLSAQKGTSGETYNVCSNRKIQIRKVLEIALRFCSKKIEVKENVPKKMRKSDEDIILGDNSKLKKELGFRITQSIDEILKDMFDYWIDFYKK